MLLEETKFEKKKKKKNIRTELYSTHDHCEAAKCSTNWAVDWSQLSGAKTKISLPKHPNNSIDIFKIY